MPAGPLFGTPHKRQAPGACLFFMPTRGLRALHKGEIFMEKIGMIGLGIMGCPIAKNLCAAGADLTVFDLDQQRVEQLKALGASAGSYADIARTCDVILMIRCSTSSAPALCWWAARAAAAPPSWPTRSSST